MNDGVAASEAVDLSKKVISTSSLITHIVERRIEYLLGTLVAYQLGLLDQVVSAGQQCIA
jgi:hypothetical protein